MRRVLFPAVCGILILSSSGPTAPSGRPAAEPKADEAAVRRARQTVRMLDDVYKSAIVLITDKYVNDKKDYPAGRAAIRWLNDVAKKGWPEARLIDVSGRTSSPDSGRNPTARRS